LAVTCVCDNAFEGRNGNQVGCADYAVQNSFAGVFFAGVCLPELIMFRS
jgi:hypothetical protein